METGRERTLHWNLLLPSNILIDTDTEEELPIRKYSVRTPKPKEQRVTENDAGESDTDSEELPMFLSVSQSKQIVTLDNGLAEGDSQKVTLLKGRVGEEQKADKANLWWTKEHH